ncbi:methyltransferase [Paenibacillus sp. J31TS4]|uniref:class I SAM-dependent methyltransferase n=1 Tax=Paenibacillus sp. J31TS4 TaxID=2807195 RepID=UPI001B18A7F5|nr:class I SAM-dependent methyltransferase [Paenibacillus sp. J31TS4]GIP39402.1 methyltransferase [Paenibacillus sp. J31TS4]
MSFSHYGELCTELYELTKPVGTSFGGDIEFYRDRLQTCEGPLLEAMCGSGRVLIPLLEAGLPVEGTDTSVEMLAACRAECEKRGLAPELREADLVTMSLGRQYGAIFIPGGSFLLIDDRDASLRALRNLFEHLKPGGRLLLDLFLPDPSFQTGSFGGTSVFSCPNGDTITMEGKLLEADLFHQRKVTLLKYEKWRGGALLQTELQRFALRWYGVEEFRLLLEATGFTEVAVYADFDPAKTPDSPKQKYIYEAVRPV